MSVRISFSKDDDSGTALLPTFSRESLSSRDSSQSSRGSISSRESWTTPKNHTGHSEVATWILPALFWMTCSTVISLPGLTQQLGTLDWSNPRSVFWITAGATAENILLLSMGSWLAMQMTTATRLRVLWGVTMLLLFAVSVFLALGDYSFRHKTNGTPPTLWIIAAGLKHAVEEIQSQLDSDLSSSLRILATLVGAYVKGVLLYGIGVRIYSSLKLGTSRNSLLFKTLAVLVLYLQGAWMPVTNAFLCCLGSVVLTPPGSNLRLKSDTNFDHILPRPGAPNVILLVQESMSADVLHSPEGVQRTPFFHNHMQTMDNMYRFSNARTVAGTTLVGLSAILTGKVPFTEQGAEAVFNTTLATDFKQQGYETAMVSSYQADWTGTGWSMLTKLLVYDYDTVIDPKKIKVKPVNEVGIDDRILLDHFDQWLENRKPIPNATAARPFFAPILFFNTHTPFLAPSNVTDRTERYLNSLETMDESFEKLFRILERRGELNNTIIIGASDHGETLHNDGIIRFIKSSSHILHVPLFFHIPKRFLTHSEHTILQQNQHQLVSNLDVFPTIQHILQKYSVNSTSTTIGTTVTTDKNVVIHENGFLLGQDLLNGRIDDHRITLGWQGIPMETCGQFGMYHRANATFVNRWSGSYYTGEWTGNDRLIHYPIDAGSNGNLGKPPVEMAGEIREEWYDAIQSLDNMEFYLRETKQQFRGQGKLCGVALCLPK